MPTRLYVKNLSSRTHSHDLELVFLPYGRIQDVVIYDRYASVIFDDQEDADDARYNLNGWEVHGRRITVSDSVPSGGFDVGDQYNKHRRRSAPPGPGYCFDCGRNDHYCVRGCKAGDLKNKYFCFDESGGYRVIVCKYGPEYIMGLNYSRSPVRSQSPSPRRRGRGRHRSYSRCRCHSNSRGRSHSRSSPVTSNSHKRGRVCCRSYGGSKDVIHNHNRSHRYRLVHSSKHLTCLGYFVNRSRTFMNLGQERGGVTELAPSAQFTYFGDEGKKLKELSLGNLDESLRRLLHCQEVEIVGSSNGFLLCCANRKENVKYIICNPVTKEYRNLPELEEEYREVVVAFLCSGDAASLDGVNYEVIRARQGNVRGHSKVLNIDTFSSYTKKWSKARLKCASEFVLLLGNQPGFSIKEVIYWPVYNRCVLAYDRSKQILKLIRVHGKGRDFECHAEYFFELQGKIHYVNYNDEGIRIWFLEEDVEKGDKWIKKHQVYFREIKEQNPGIVIGLLDITGSHPHMIIIGFHPHKPHLISVWCAYRLYWYDMESGKLDEIADFMWPGSPCHYFLFQYKV